MVDGNCIPGQVGTITCRLAVIGSRGRIHVILCRWLPVLHPLRWKGATAHCIQLVAVLVPPHGFESVVLWITTGNFVPPPRNRTDRKWETRATILHAPLGGTGKSNALLGPFLFVDRSGG